MSKLHSTFQEVNFVKIISNKFFRVLLAKFFLIYLNFREKVEEKTFENETSEIRRPRLKLERA